MPTVRKSLETIVREGGGTLDHAKLESQCDADIEDQAVEDDSDFDWSAELRNRARVVKPNEVLEKA